LNKNKRLVKHTEMAQQNSITNIALLASGKGTNVQNFINYYRIHDRVKISLIVSDNPNAYVLKRANNENIPSIVIEKQKWKDENFVLSVFQQYNIGFIVLAGYLSLIPSYLIKAYHNKIINIHPALLPNYGGKGMYGMKVHETVIAAGETKSGISIHYVNEEYDKGTVIFQASCSIREEDTPESLAKKIHKLEYNNYPRVLEGLI
jgi:phosphoribosylglycinamide formyltransferase 1